jgi:hypothetical protein
MRTENANVVLRKAGGFQPVRHGLGGFGGVTRGLGCIDLNQLSIDIARQTIVCAIVGKGSDQQKED